MQTIQDIEHGILAATPLMYVVTAEEGRFLSEVERICMTRSRKLWVHAISTGIYNVHFAWMDGSWKKPRYTCVQRELSDPVALLENLRERSHDDGVFVLLDFHVAWRDTMVKRLTRDVVRHFRQTKNSMIVVASVAELPADLVTEITRFDFPLPGRAEIAAKLESVLESRSLRGMPIRLKEGDVGRIVEMALGLTLADFECALNWTVARGSGQTGAELIADVLGVKKQVVRRSGTMHWCESNEAMDRIGGMNVLKTWFEKRRRAFTAEATGFGLPRPKGITDLGLLVEALREMGITNEDPISAGAALPAGNMLISGFWKGYRVGFAKDKNGEIHAVGDMDAPFMRNQNLQNQIRQRYSLAAVRRKVVEMSYHVAKVEALEDGSIRLVARQWR